MSQFRLRTISLLFCTFFLIALAICWDGMAAPFIYDSGAKLEFRGQLLNHGFLSALSVFPQRPLPVLTFYVTYLLFDMMPGYFRVFNCMLLAAVCVCVTVLIHMLLNLPGSWNRGSSGEKKALSMACGLMYLVHPLQTYVTLYIWQRMALMACLFYFASVAVYIAIRSGRIQNKLAGYAACLVLFVCAMLSKENSVTLPAVLVMCEMAFFQEHWKNVLKRAGVYALVVGVVAGMLSFLQHPHGRLELGSGILATLSVYYAESGISLIEVILTQARVLFNYLSLILAPLPSRVQLISPQMISRSLTDPPITAVAVWAALGLAAAGVHLVRRRPLCGVGILFFIINLVPEPVLAPQYAFFGYRAVLPMFGLLLVLSDVVLTALESVHQQESRKWMRIGLCSLLTGVVILAAAAAHDRAVIWSDRIRFWQETVDGFPRSSEPFEHRVAVQALANLGRALCLEGRNSEAIEPLHRALELNPTYVVAVVWLGYAHEKLGRSETAESLFKRAMELDPDLQFAHARLGMLLMSQNRYQEALKHLKKALDLAPGDLDVRATLDEAEQRGIRRGGAGGCLELDTRWAEEDRKTSIIVSRCGREGAPSPGR